MQRHQHTHLLAVNSLDNDTRNYTDFVLGSWQSKICLMSGPTDLHFNIHTYTFSR